VGAGSGMGGGIRKIKAIRLGAYYYSLVLNAQPCKYDIYKSSRRHIHDPVPSSLKVKGIRFYILSKTKIIPVQGINKNFVFTAYQQKFLDTLYIETLTAVQYRVSHFTKVEQFP
jgi:hypothetical protein